MVVDQTDHDIPHHPSVFRQASPGDHNRSAAARGEMNEFLKASHREKIYVLEIKSNES